MKNWKIKILKIKKNKKKINKKIIKLYILYDMEKICIINVVKEIDIF